MNTPTTYQGYRNSKIESGLRYQDFVVDCCFNILKLPIAIYSSRFYQLKIGESVNGVEIKNDEKYALTGNLWIEKGEKAHPREGDYFPSGIYRDDNSWLYIIGDYDTIFIFSKRLLILLDKCGKYPERANTTKTSIGFLLPSADAKKYAAHILTPNASEKIEKTVLDLKAVGHEIYRSMIEGNSRQMLLDLG